MKVVLLQLLLTSVALCLPRLDPLVHTDIGLIRGLQAADGDYAMFLGIPYAMVNESNPFGLSKPHPAFDDVFEAYDDSAICPQIDEDTDEFVGSLDCLHLSVYVPNKATTRNRFPVVVWIHGGGFQFGNYGRQLYGPKYLVRNDVIVVNVNYRLGPFGFMCLHTADVPGNQGLKDQLTALRWVRKNIEAFGGDVNRVTIFGESAGGASVDFHLLYAQEQLFNQAILQSGTAICPWATTVAETKAPLSIAEFLGLDTEDIDVALNFLAEAGPQLVTEAASKVSKISFLPCVEKEFEGVERYITEHPENRAVQNVKNIPIIAGYNSHEMLIDYGVFPAGYQDLNVFYDNMAKTFDLSKDEDLVTLVRQFYIGDEVTSIDLTYELMNFESDYYFNYPVYRSIQKYLANGGKVYHYLFSYSGERNFVKIANNITAEGAAHADELGYLFDVPYLFSREPSEEDQLVIDRMTTMWTNFVKYGDPTPETSDLLPVKWDVATKNILNYLDINSDLTFKRRPFNDRTAFWDLLYKLNIQLFKSFKDQDQE